MYVSYSITKLSHLLKLCYYLQRLFLSNFVAYSVCQQCSDCEGVVSEDGVSSSLAPPSKNLGTLLFLCKYLYHSCNNIFTFPGKSCGVVAHVGIGIPPRFVGRYWAAILMHLAIRLQPIQGYVRGNNARTRDTRSDIVSWHAALLKFRNYFFSNTAENRSFLHNS